MVLWHLELLEHNTATGKIVRNSFLFLLSVVFLAFLLRFWQLGTNPPSMYWDEVSQGYNAYSILKTGRDEHGEFLPIARFKAFGDYKAPVYIYLDVPAIALFGKNAFAVRFPSAFFGTLSVFVVFFLVVEIFYKKEHRYILGLITAFLLAISPWHIQLSRAAFEGNIATFFTILATCLFFIGKRKGNWILFLSIVSFIAAFYAFNAHRVFIPLFVVFISLLYFKEIIAHKKLLLATIIAGFLLLLPFLLYLKTPESKLRFNEVNIFTDLEVIKESNRLIAEDTNAFTSQIIHNRRVLYGFSYIKHYFDFLNPRFLFFTGDENPRFSLQSNGQLFLWILPLLLFGTYSLCKEKTKTTAFIIGWFLLAPVAAATARETPHALRAETYIPVYEIIAAAGMMYLYTFLKKYSLYFRFASIGFLIVIFLSIFIFLHDYYGHYPTKYSGVWQFGYKEAIEEAEKIKNEYDYVVVSSTYGRPYIYVLFYGNVDPRDYWNNSSIKADPFGFYHVDRVGKYLFRENIIDKADDGKKVLYVASKGEVPHNFKIIQTVSFLNGETAFVLAGQN